MSGPFRGSINEIRDRLMGTTKKKMVALEIYSEIIGEYDKLGQDEEAFVQDDDETIEILIGGDTTVCVEDGKVVIDFEQTRTNSFEGGIAIEVPINDEVTNNVILVLKALKFARGIS